MLFRPRQARKRLSALFTAFFALSATVGTASPASAATAAVYNLDAGATITYVTPTSSSPITSLSTETLTGSYTLTHLDTSSNQFAEEFAVDGIHFQTPSGVTFDLASSPQSKFFCWKPPYDYCTPQFSLTTANFPTPGIGNVVIKSSGFTGPNDPKFEGPITDPTGFNWTQSNQYVDGYGVYREIGGGSLELVAMIKFHATKYVPPAPAKYIVDPGATITYVTPHSSGEYAGTVLSTQSLSGEYTLELQPSSPYFGAHNFKLTSMHLTTSDGVSLDTAPGASSDFPCWDVAGHCGPQVSLQTSNFATASTVIIQGTGMTGPNDPRFEGPVTNPTGFNWTQSNQYVDGYGVYRNGQFGLELVAMIKFHATRSDLVDVIAPTINITTPAEGGIYTEGQTIASSFTCTDATPNPSCYGSPNIDTSSPGNKTFTVYASDAWGNYTSKSVNYTVVSPFPELKFTVDAGGQITYYVPTSSAPTQVTGTDGLTGTYTIRQRVNSPYFGGTLFDVVSMTLQTPDGVTFQTTPGAAYNRLVCWQSYGHCSPEISLTATNLPNASSVQIKSTGMTGPNDPRFEGALSDPTGFNWLQTNQYVNGFGVYAGSDLVAGIKFHASKYVPDTTAPVVHISTPTEGATYTEGQSVSSSFACTDNVTTSPGCYGDPTVDTSTPGNKTFTVYAYDAAGNSASATVNYTVEAAFEPITYDIDAGGAITYYQPSSFAPTPVTGTDGLTGSYTIRQRAISPTPGTTYFDVLSMTLETPNGVTFQTLPFSNNSLTCWNTMGHCSPQISLRATNLPTATSVQIQSTGMTGPNDPRWEGPVSGPTGFNWLQTNQYVNGFGVYGGGQLVAGIKFHASKYVPDTTPPVINVTAPVEGATYSLGEVVTPSYSCSSDAVRCDGDANVFTEAVGPGAFVVIADDEYGNRSSVTINFNVVAGYASETVTNGGTVTSDPANLGATFDTPVQTVISAPSSVSGDISIVPETLGSDPTGYTLFGSQIELTGPAATAEQPYTVSFTVDWSAFEGLAPSDVQIFRNGVAITGCTSPTAAIPDPCIVSRGFKPGGSGDALIVVRTSHFSTWNVGRVDYNLSGPFAPVDATLVNTAKAGSAIPVGFSLGGNRGLDVFVAGSPSSKGSSTCGGGTDEIEQTVAAGNSGLTYDAVTGKYTYAWKTDKSWRGCRTLTLAFKDGSTLQARFSFR